MIILSDSASYEYFENYVELRAPMGRSATQFGLRTCGPCDCFVLAHFSGLQIAAPVAAGLSVCCVVNRGNCTQSVGGLCCFLPL
jgi:hypothetical protein